MDFIDFIHILKKNLNFFVITVILIFILLQKFIPIDKTGETSDGKDCRHPHQKGKHWREKKTPVLPETKILLKFENC